MSAGDDLFDASQSSSSFDGEHRGSPRVHVTFRALAQLSPTLHFQGRAQDISVHGCAVLFENAIPAATTIQIYLQFPPIGLGQVPVFQATGQVQYHVLIGGISLFRHGIRFTTIPSDSKQLLTRFLERFD